MLDLPKLLRGQSETETTKATGVTRSTLWRIKKGKSYSNQTYKKLAKHFGEDVPDKLPVFMRDLTIEEFKILMTEIFQNV